MGMTADEENKDADVKLLDAKADDVKLDAAERGADADAKDEKTERGGDADAKDEKAADAKDAAPPAPPPFRFFQEFLPLLRDIHAMVVALPGYGPFLAKYGALQVVRGDRWQRQCDACARCVRTSFLVCVCVCCRTTPNFCPTHAMHAFDR